MIRSFALFSGLSLWQIWSLNGQYTTCADWMEQHHKYELENGVFEITASSLGESQDMWCSFDYTNNYGWTLINSGTKNTMYNDRYIPWSTDDPSNFDDVLNYKDTDYRADKDWMLYLQSESDYILASCNFNVSFNQDWVLFDLDTMGYNFITDTGDSVGDCVTIVSANIVGYECFSDTVKVSFVGAPHLSEQDTCGCNNLDDSGTGSTDYFGAYWHTITDFTCTETSISTTNWWYGSAINNYDPSEAPTRSPTIKPTGVPSVSPSDQPTDRPTDRPSDSPTGYPSVQPTIIPSVQPSMQPHEIRAPTIEPSWAPSFSSVNEENEDGGNSFEDWIIKWEHLAIIIGVMLICCIGLCIITLCCYLLKRNSKQQIHVVQVEVPSRDNSFDAGGGNNYVAYNPISQPPAGHGLYNQPNNHNVYNPPPPPNQEIVGKADVHLVEKFDARRELGQVKPNAR